MIISTVKHSQQSDHHDHDHQHSQQSDHHDHDHQHSQAQSTK